MKHNKLNHTAQLAGLLHDKWETVPGMQGSKGNDRAGPHRTTVAGVRHIQAAAREQRADCGGAVTLPAAGGAQGGVQRCTAQAASSAPTMQQVPGTQAADSMACLVAAARRRWCRREER